MRFLILALRLCGLALLCLGGGLGVAPGVQAQQAPQALWQEGTTDIYRRVLTLPRAQVHASASAAAPVRLATVPAFTVYYVYGEATAEGQAWVEVGTRPTGGSIGWVPKAATEDWRSMLVMTYAPAGRRGRVMFFNEENTLRTLMDAPDRLDHVHALMRRIEAGQFEDGLLAAVEPEAVVDRRANPYLMPILDWDYAELDTGGEAVLLQVGGLNAAMAEASPQQQPQAETPPPFRIGVVFVLDTTLSMGPYIERTYETVRTIYNKLELAGSLDRVAFGMVGYRDHLTHNQDIGYVTRIYQELDPNAPPETILRNLEKVRAVTVSTDEWHEDAFAGLHVAMTQMNWDPFDARIIVLVTDAGARPAHDPHVAYPGVDVRRLVDQANRSNISIFPVHLRTEEAARLDNMAEAERTYRGLGRTGDMNVDKYLGVESGSLSRFGEALADMVNQIQRAVETTDPTTGQLLNRESVEQAETPMGAMLINEVFRAQLEYVGRHQGTQAPDFYRAWTSDRDLSNPNNTALTVGVFLNRTQLSGLAQSLRLIVDQAMASEVDAGSFFDNLQSLSATMSTDPGRGAAGQFDDLAGSGLLPSYLENLPYHSRVLMLTRDLWLDWGMIRQQEFISELVSKIETYNAIDRDTGNWIDLGAGDPALAVYPVPLALLP